MGLDALLYGTVRSTLLSMDPLPTLNHAYQVVIQEGSVQLEASSGNREERDQMVAFKLNANIKGKGKMADPSNSDRNHLFCYHCNRVGHDETTCFQIHGFPEWWGDRLRGGRGSGRGGAQGGRGPRRTGSFTYGRGRGPARFTNTTQVTLANAGQNHGASNNIAVTDSSTAAGLTAAQWQQLLDLLNIPKGKDHLHGPYDEEVDWSG
ncbi:hypothetical protein RND81_06G164500 [Saponaria officinalis]|uniref:CCHC-type domain-containing protein n=1 Tax=Saponaria officinalis TaxID=3572 RepID=A0AAW1KAU6_SAPOF